ncbi:hypothetical protein QPK87_36345 [Kamptonema cortianum]|nr:hypothetical protein [Kamptonema cortianum]
MRTPKRGQQYFRLIFQVSPMLRFEEMWTQHTAQRTVAKIAFPLPEHHIHDAHRIGGKLIIEQAVIVIDHILDHGAGSPTPQRRPFSVIGHQV